MMITNTDFLLAKKYLLVVFLIIGVEISDAFSQDSGQLEELSAYLMDFSADESGNANESYLINIKILNLNQAHSLKIEMVDNKKTVIISQNFQVIKENERGVLLKSENATYQEENGLIRLECQFGFPSLYLSEKTYLRAYGLGVGGIITNTLEFRVH